MKAFYLVVAFTGSGNKAPRIHIKLGNRQRCVVAYDYLVDGLRPSPRIQEGG